MPTFSLDGQDTEFEPGQTILEVAHAKGTNVPHYCWHPGLSIAGNCRICMVEVEGMRGTQIGCNTQIREGMVVRTQSNTAVKAQREVMELLLVNHPLDCPICDQAGECKLQEYSYEFGAHGSRFEFPKVHKAKNVEFSDKVTFDGERCILCTRCVRFCEEVAGEDELEIVGRGDANTVAVARGEVLSNPYQMNTIDVCPVGALTSTDFRFKSRVWFLEQVRTVCPSCSRGCNVTVGARWNKILRLVPAENPDVNQWWMCDDGRLNYEHVAADDRLGGPMVRRAGVLQEVSWDEALEAAVEGLKEAGPHLFALVSARLTNEEIWLAQRLLDALGTPHRDVKKRDWPKDDLLRTGDGNPNSAGAELLGVRPGEGGVGLAAMTSEDWGKAGIRAVFLCGEDLDDRPELLGRLQDADFVLVIDYHGTVSAMDVATVVLPGVTSFEKEGSFLNVDGRLQRLQPTVRAPGEARPDWKILGDLRHRIEGVGPPRSAAAVFRSMAGEVPGFSGLTHGKLATHGKALVGADNSVPESSTATGTPTGEQA